MASTGASTPRPAKSVREGAERIRALGESAAAHAGNAAALLRLAARQREKPKRRW